jgi:hypothetical protein
MPRAFPPEAAAQQATYRLALGDTVLNYRLFWTNAPRRYDAGTTLTLYEDGARDSNEYHRYILVEERQVEWTRGRNASGLYQTVESDMPFDIGQTLWDTIHAALGSTD